VLGEFSGAGSRLDESTRRGLWKSGHFEYDQPSTMPSPSSVKDWRQTPRTGQ
jgi:hypothetical protein